MQFIGRVQVEHSKAIPRNPRACLRMIYLQSFIMAAAARLAQGFDLFVYECRWKFD